MRLSELLRSEVVDSRGEPVGQVQDARFAKDGPVQGGFGRAYRIESLIVGPGAFGARLRYDRGQVEGPYPVKWLFQWLHRKARLVDWGLISSIEDGTIRIRAGKDELPEVPPLSR